MGGDWGWGLNSNSSRRWWSRIFPKLKELENLTWAQLALPSGDKKRGNHHHSIPVEKLNPKAQRRLREIGQNDTDDLYSLRLSNKERIFGIREGRVFKILWYDPNHEVCPSIRK